MTSLKGPRCAFECSADHCGQLNAFVNLKRVQVRRFASSRILSWLILVLAMLQKAASAARGEAYHRRPTGNALKRAAKLALIVPILASSSSLVEPAVLSRSSRLAPLEPIRKSKHDGDIGCTSSYVQLSCSPQTEDYIQQRRSGMSVNKRTRLTNYARNLHPTWRRRRKAHSAHSSYKASTKASTLKRD